MQADFGIWQAGAALVLIGLAALYGAGWRRLHRVYPRLASGARLLAFGVAFTALTLALVWPLPGWSNYLLTLRSLQKVMVAMIAPPLLWLACPVHVIVWDRRELRGGLVALRRGKSRAAGWVRAATQPLVAWFAFVAAFLFWHDPQSVPFLVGGRLHYAAPWLLLAAALLYWWHVVDTGPRLHHTFPTWLLIPYLLTVEILNMAAGMTIAFSAQPVYAHFAAVHTQFGDRLPLGVIADQITGGALVWVFGSLVYIASIVLVLHRLFCREGSNAPQPLPHWDDNEKFIAPGLEERARQNALRGVDLSHR
jgi:cytochrome c oxidase assembly factor CtaG